MTFKCSLNVFSTKFSAREISEIINLDFDEQRIKGEKVHPKSTKIFSENVWILNSGLSSDTTLDLQILNLIEKINKNESTIAELNDDFEVICQCVIKGDANPILNFPKEVICGLAKIKAELDIDMYIV